MSNAVAQWEASWRARIDEIRAALPKIVEALETRNRLLDALEEKS